MVGKMYATDWLSSMLTAVLTPIAACACPIGCWQDVSQLARQGVPNEFGRGEPEFDREPLGRSWPVLFDPDDHELMVGLFVWLGIGLAGVLATALWANILHIVFG